MLRTVNDKSIAWYVRATALLDRFERGEGASDLAKRVLIAVLLLGIVGGIIAAGAQAAASQAAASMSSPGF
ncbi:MAG: hypothetical protein JXB47_15505 [Anaerolineae bacterium]|nr:hypothetical protein [Anaerolineae bacterium]